MEAVLRGSSGEEPVWVWGLSSLSACCVDFKFPSSAFPSMSTRGPFRLQSGYTGEEWKDQSERRVW